METLFIASVYVVIFISRLIYEPLQPSAVVVDHLLCLDILHKAVRNSLRIVWPPSYQFLVGPDSLIYLLLAMNLQL